jgi:phenylsuccinyl-CoA transferase
MLDMGSPPGDLRRSGNEHRQFIPVNAYPVSDGHVLVAVGSDAQWGRLTELSMFAALAEDRFTTNEGRRAHREDLHAAIGAITAQHARAEVSRALAEASIPHAPILPIEDVWDLDFVRSTALRTTTPDGRIVRLPPPAVATPHLDRIGGELPFAPRYGEHTDAVLAEIGYDAATIEALHRAGSIA